MYIFYVNITTSISMITTQFKKKQKKHVFVENPKNDMDILIDVRNIRWNEMTYRWYHGH